MFGSNTHPKFFKDIFVIIDALLLGFVDERCKIASTKKHL